MSNAPEVIVNNLSTMGIIFSDVSILLGVVFVCVSLFEFKRHGEQTSNMSQQSSVFGPLCTLLAGSFFLVLPTFIYTLLHAFWGTYSPFQWDDSVAPSGSLRGPYDVVIAFVRLIGVGTMMRGIYLLSRLGKQGGQPGNAGKAITHIIAATLCINIVGTYQLLCSILDFAT